MKKLMAGGAAALAIATGSLGVAAFSPLGVAGAQTDGSGAATTTTEAPRRGGHVTEALKALVTDGTITQAQADAITAKLDALHAANPGSHGARGAKGTAGATTDEIAGVLGITADALRTQLQSGATLRSIAGDKVAALTTLLTQKANARIDEQRAAGTIDQAKADELKAGVAAKVEAMLDRTGGVKGPKGDGGRGGRGNRGAMPSSTTPSSTTPSSTTGGA